MTRRFFLAGLATPTLAYGWIRYVEPTWFEVTHTRVLLPGIRPKRLLQVSDLHVSDGLTAEELERGLMAGLAQRPDLICFTGDFVSSTNRFDRPGLERLLRRAADTAPSFAILGNHDGESECLGDLIGSAGVNLLLNRSVEVDDLTLVGVADIWSREFDPSSAFSKARHSKTKLVLCHNPDGKDALVGERWDLMLSGHTHGGQARLPGVDPTWMPVKDKRFVSGLYRWQDRQLFISRGLGAPMHVRAFCRPELSILHLG